MWTDTSPQMINRSQINPWKDAQQHQLLGNCKLKSQLYTTMHPLERLKLKSQTTLSSARSRVSGTLLHYWWERKSTTPSENHWVISSKGKPTYTPCNPAVPWLGIPREMQTYSRKKTCMAALFVTAPNNYHVNIHKRWMDEQMVASTYKGWKNIDKKRVHNIDSIPENEN